VTKDDSVKIRWGPFVLEIPGNVLERAFDLITTDPRVDLHPDTMREMPVDGEFKLLDPPPKVEKRHEKDHLDDTEVGEK